MAAPSTTSLRGQQTKYFFYKDHWFNGPEGSYTKDEDIAGDGEHPEIAGYPNNILANTQWRYEFDGEFLCMTYNPITDHFAIKEGEYVL